MSILVLTVGGSHQPIVTSIQDLQPEYVCFLCSKQSRQQVEGPGKVLKASFRDEKPSLPNIVTLSRLSEEQYEVVVFEEVDELNHCYLTATACLQKMHAERPGNPLFVDYTGGTKTMSVGLAAAALDDGRCEIRIVTGQRNDMVRVVDHTQYVRPAPIGDAQARRALRSARSFLRNYQYGAAEQVLRQAISRYHFSSEIRQQVQVTLQLCSAYEAWDSFEHTTARQRLQPWRRYAVDHGRLLDAVEGGIREFEESEGRVLPGPSVVMDIVRNAERRAHQRRYDDASARLYRAIELLAQLRLYHGYGLLTSDVEVERLPEGPLREQMEARRDPKGSIKIGLRAAWELLEALEKDEQGEESLGGLYGRRKKMLLNFLSRRNESILAHGLKPVLEQEFHQKAQPVLAFLKEGVRLLMESNPKQWKRLPAFEQFPSEPHWLEE
jgi:CRISPR-associated protein (TIGR02710 family)